MIRKKTLTRREFLGLAAGAATGTLLAACAQPQLAPAPTIAPAAPAAPAKAAEPTKAPAAPAAPAASSVKADKQELVVFPQFMGNPFDVAELDPARRGTWGFHSLLWAPLVFGDTAANVIKEKSVAESWEISPDGKVYTFKLRKDAKYSDGSPITAKDFANFFGYLAMMATSQAAGYRDNFGSAKRLLFDVQGLLDSGKTATYDEFGATQVPGVKAVDDATLQITLTAPAENFIKRLTVSVVAVSTKTFEEARKAKYDLNDYWPGHTIYSGPYKVLEVKPGESYTMAPNENYFGPKPVITKITSRFVSADVNTVLTAFGNKEIDAWSVPLSADAVRQALKDPYMGQALTEIPTWLVAQLWTTPNEPFDDVHVRRALSMAINKEALIKLLNAGSDKALYRQVNTHRNPAVPHCEKETAAVKAYPYDVAKAKDELKQSKYGAAVTDMELHLYAPTPAELMIMEPVQKMLQENLGFKKVTIHNERVPDLNKPPFPIHLWYNTQQPWYPDLSDTIHNMAIYLRDKEWATGEARRYIDVPYLPKIKELDAQSLVEQDSAKKCQVIQNLLTTWNDDVFSLDFAVPIGYYLLAPWVKDVDWYANAGQGKPLNWEKMWVAKR